MQKMQWSKGEATANAVKAAISHLSTEGAKTITCDRESEFACWREKKELNCWMYFSELCKAERSE